MNATLRILSLLLVLFAIGVSCSQETEDSAVPEPAAQRPLNPNGDSELALLMRAMFEEAEQIQQQIANDEPITFSLKHQELLTATATEPEKAASDEYKAYATAYLQAIQNLEASSPDERLELYDNMVNNCLVCHQAMCPGPIGRIKKLQ